MSAPSSGVCNRKLPESKASLSTCSRCRTSRSKIASAARSIQFSLEDADPKELALWTNKLVEKLKTLPELRDVATDQQNQAAEANLVIDRDTASQARRQRQRDRQHPVRRLRPAAGVDHVHPVEPVSRGAGGRSHLPQRSRLAEEHLRAQRDGPEPASSRAHQPGLESGCGVQSTSGSSAQVPLSAISHWETGSGAAGHQPPGPVSCRHRLVQPRRRRLPRRSGEGHRSRAAGDRHACRASRAPSRGRRAPSRHRWPMKAG